MPSDDARLPSTPPPAPAVWCLIGAVGALSVVGVAALLAGLLSRPAGAVTAGAPGMPPAPALRPALAGAPIMPPAVPPPPAPPAGEFTAARATFTSASPPPMLPVLAAASAAPSAVSPQEVIARVKRSVVLVVAQMPDSMATGSGFVVGPHQVATCSHLVDQSVSLTVVTSEGQQLRAALARSDPRNDVAILDCDGIPGAPLLLGPADSGREGDEVAVTGYPETLSMMEQGFTPVASTSRGSISARRWRETPRGPIEVLQTDAAVNPGNSGGPVYTIRDGVVVGIAASTLTHSQGLNFAAPVDALRRLTGW